MPKIRPPKESLQEKQPVPAGIYSFRLDGFSPKSSNKGDSTNLNPKLVIVNDPNFNDNRIFENLNSEAGWIQKDFCHSLGIEMEEGEIFPGEFLGPNDKPDQWSYIGPLLGRIGQCEVVLVPKQDANGNQKAGFKNSIKRYICAIPGCQVKHTANLIK